MSGCVLIMIDESADMGKRFSKDAKKTKGESVATAVNALLQRLAQGPDLDVAIVGYRTESEEESNVGCRWTGPLEGRDFVRTSELAASPATVEQRSRPNGSTVDFNVWYQPQLGQRGPQVAAFEYCGQLLTQWSEAADSSAGIPLVVNISAGSSADGNPLRAVQSIQKMQVGADSPIVLQVHLASSDSVPPIRYPSKSVFVTIPPAKDLFNRTSEIPDVLRDALRAADIVTHTGARGMVYNAQMIDLVRCLSLIDTHTKDWSAASPPDESDVYPEPEDETETYPGPEEEPEPYPGTEAEAPEEETQVTEFIDDESEGYPEPDAEAEPYPDDAEDAYPAGPERELEDDQDAYPAPEPAPSVPEMGALSPDQPGLMIFVLDRSLDDPYVADPKNPCARLQQKMGDMVEILAKFGGGSVDVGVVSYGDMDGEVDVRATLEGTLGGRSFARDNELFDGAVRVDEFEEEIVDAAANILKIPRRRPVLVEVDPTAAASAVPAFTQVAEMISTWCADNPTSTWAPIVVHLTRGRVGDVTAEDAIGQLQAISTTSGAPVTVYHVVETEAQQAAMMYPDGSEPIEDADLQTLCRLSSPLLDREKLAIEKPTISDQAIGFVVNGTCNLLIEAVKRAARS